LTDKDGKLWLRTEDAGFLDEEGRIWLVGRVKWRVDHDDKHYWSISVEQKVVNNYPSVNRTVSLGQLLK